MDLVRELLRTERQRREEALGRIREDGDNQEKSLKDRMERLENESRDFFGKMEGYLEGGVNRVQEEVEIFRKQLMAESEKVAELVRKEIEARFSSDV
jgi:Skp family chaperone for outer membrane proteins